MSAGAKILTVVGFWVVLYAGGFGLRNTVDTATNQRCLTLKAVVTVKEDCQPELTPVMPHRSLGETEIRL